MMSSKVKIINELLLIEVLSEIKVRFDPKLNVLSYETIV